jgi:hypothetical protein
MLYWIRLEFPDAGLAPFEHVQVARLAMPRGLGQFHGLLGRDLLRRWDSFLHEGRRGRYSLRDTLGCWVGCFSCRIEYTPSLPFPPLEPLQGSFGFAREPGGRGAGGELFQQVAGVATADAFQERGHAHGLELRAGKGQPIKLGQQVLNAVLRLGRGRFLQSLAQSRLGQLGIAF